MEDFVPYELAVKLKEKGFNIQKHSNYLYYNGELVEVKNHYNISPYEIAPTISQVLKWLREEKKIFILIDVRMDLSWYYEIWGIEISLHPLGCVPYQKHQSYEQATLAGIEYVIDNLI